MDAATMLQVIAGYDAEDPYCSDVPVGDYLTSIDAGIRGWRVAILAGELVEPADSLVQMAVRQAAGLLESLGAKLEEVEIPGLLQAAQANGLMVTSDAAAFYQDRMKNCPEDFGIDVLKRLLTELLYFNRISQARRTRPWLEADGDLLQAIRPVGPACYADPGASSACPGRCRTRPAAHPLYRAIQPDRLTCNNAALWVCPGGASRLAGGAADRGASLG
jgi:hypothetical protein